MTLRSRSPRIALTAGMRGWARIPYDPDTDPALPPDTEHLEPAVSTDHTLTPADIADRARILGAEIGFTADRSQYRITPPSDATTPDGSRPSPVHFPVAEFRSKADRTLTVRNLRNNGLDVTADRDWDGDTATAATPDPIAGVGKLELTGARPVLAYSRADDDTAPGEDEIAARLGEAVARMLEPVTEALDKLAARVDTLETAPARAAATRVDQLDRSVGSLAQRVSGAERTGENLTTGLETARTALGRIDTRLTDVTDQVTARLDALETATPAPAAPTESAWIGETRAQVRATLEPFRGGAFLPRATIAELMGLAITGDDPEGKRLSYVLRLMRDENELESTGTKSATRWRLTPNPEHR